MELQFRFGPSIDLSSLVFPHSLAPSNRKNEHLQNLNSIHSLLDSNFHYNTPHGSESFIILNCAGSDISSAAQSSNTYTEDQSDMHTSHLEELADRLDKVDEEYSEVKTAVDGLKDEVYAARNTLKQQIQHGKLAIEELQEQTVDLDRRLSAEQGMHEEAMKTVDRTFLALIEVLEKRRFIQKSTIGFDEKLMEIDEHHGLLSEMQTTTNMLKRGIKKIGNKSKQSTQKKVEPRLDVKNVGEQVETLEKQIGNMFAIAEKSLSRCSRQTRSDISSVLETAELGPSLFEVSPEKQLQTCRSFDPVALTVYNSHSELESISSEMLVE